MTNSSSLQLVSIVIPTFNYARYLGDAIASCINQSTAAEILVVDDGSTDNPAAIVRSFPSVHIISQAHRGVSAARNFGLRTARGKFVVFLDADDRLLPDAVRSNLLCFEAHPELGLVYGAYRKINSDGDVVKTVSTHPPGTNLYRRLLFGNIIGPPGTVMFRRDCLFAVGGFDTSLNFCEDLDVYLRIAKQFPVACTDELILEYRQHDAQTTRDFTPVLRGALTVVKKHKKGIAEFRKVTHFWKGWYATRHAERLVEAVMNRSISTHLMIETIKMLTVTPLVLPKAFGSALRTKRGVERQ